MPASAGASPSISVFNRGHDAQQRGFTETVQAENAILAPGEEGQGDVLEILFFAYTLPTRCILKLFRDKLSHVQRP